MTTETETQPTARAEADSSPRCAVSTGSPLCVAFDLDKIHRIIADIDEALAPKVTFSEDHEAMRKEAAKRTRELMNKVRCGLARNPGVNYPTF